MVMVLDPVVVLVAASDEARLEQMCDAAASVGGCSVVGALGGRAALRHVMSRYELPSGCPDVVLFDDGLDGLESLHQTLDEACPGVRRIVAEGEVGATVDQLRQVARLVAQSYVT